MKTFILSVALLLVACLLWGECRQWAGEVQARYGDVGDE